MKSLRTLVLAQLALVLLAPALASAQEEPPPTTPEDGATLLERVRTTDAELLQISKDLPDAEGEQLTLLRNRFSELGTQQGRDLRKLLDVVAKNSKQGEDVTLMEQQVRQLLRRTSRRLRSFILSFNEDLVQASLARDSIPPSEAQVFEHRMAIETDRLNHLYLSLIELNDRMVETGMEVDEVRSFLETRLPARGRKLLEVVQLTKRQQDDFRELLKRDPDNADLQASAFAAEERLESNETALLATIHMMKMVGLPYVDLEVRALELTGEVTPEALEVEVAKGLLSRELARAKDYLLENGPRLLLRVLVILGILAAFWIAARILRMMVKKMLARRQVVPSKLLEQTLVSLVGRIVMIIGVVVALSQIGISVGPILAGLGIVGFVVGFALQDTLGNFASGGMILAYRPFDVGDMIEAAGITGKVQQMNLVSTQILTPDNQTLIVPNSKIWGDVIRNVTTRTRRRVDMVFGISYEDDVPQAERVLAEILAEHEKVLDDPEPVVKLHTLNDSSVDFVVRPWALTDDYWDVYWDITREVKLRFDREGISIPYPQHDVHLSGGATGDGPNQGKTD